jgi:cytochrome P450
MADDKATSIISESDPIEHGRLRKIFSHAFSEKALREQEDIVHEYVDMFIERIGEYGQGKNGIDMVKWYNFTTFDVSRYRLRYI